MTSHIHDYVIIGGGTAGSVLAARLSENASASVILVEAGKDTPEDGIPPDILDGLQPWLPRAAGERFMWPQFNILRSAAHPRIARSPQFYAQGRILGGGSSVNMTVANRGIPRDYDEWERLGADGWGWSDVLPFFRKGERDGFGGHDAEGRELHGTTGPIPITRADPQGWNPFTKNIATALESLGLSHLPDQNGNFEDGYFAPTANVEGGERYSAARGYLNPEVRRRSNLLILTETRVIRILFDGRRATGIEIRHADGAIDTVRGRTIILAAGALQSPAFLLRAGIGPAEDLKALDIPVLADRAGVGRNLWDHASLGIAAPLTAPAAAVARSDNRDAHSLGIRASSGIGGVAADLFLHLGVSLPENLVTGVLWVNKPSSTGWLKLTDKNPFSYPTVDFNLLSDPRDVKRLFAALGIVQKLFDHCALAGYGIIPAIAKFAEPALGGPTLRELLADEDALELWVRTHVSGVWHASGTARIGRADDPAAVVDPDGRVYGVEGLRVADASVMPTVPAANTNLPTQMIAEKLADTILRDRG